MPEGGGSGTVKGRGGEEGEPQKGGSSGEGFYQRREIGGDQTGDGGGNLNQKEQEKKKIKNTLNIIGGEIRGPVLDVLGGPE